MDVVEWAVQRRVGSDVVRCGFTNRSGGVSTGEYASLNLGPHVGDLPDAVAENRRILAEFLGCEPSWMEQVHGNHVERARPGATAGATDALLLGVGGGAAGGAACVMVADCVPLLLIGRDTACGAAVHVGRAGLLGAIALRAVAALPEPAERLTAVVGPSICGHCYEVPESMRDEAGRVVPSSTSETSWGTPSIDIPAGLREQLGAAGVLDVVIDGRCTLEDSSFHSHRRSGRSGLSAGRFVGVVQLLSDTPA